MGIQPTDQQLTQLNQIFERGLCKGIGNKDGQMCIEAAISVVLDGRFSDEPSCVHDVDRAYIMRLNDARWSSPGSRAEGMRPLLLPQLGTAGTDRSTWIERVVLGTVHRVLPLVLDGVIDAALVDDCRNAATLDAACAAADAAYAAASAADAADAADASRAVYAVCAATRAADAAADAADTTRAVYAATDAADVADVADVALATTRAADADDRALVVAVGVAVEAYDFDAYRAEEPKKENYHE